MGVGEYATDCHHPCLRRARVAARDRYHYWRIPLYYGTRLERSVSRLRRDDSPAVFWCVAAAYVALIIYVASWAFML